MPRINVLPKNIADLIAAGEVVERPSSVIKEFVENSIDAGSTKIIIEIQNGGKTYMRVTDNGCGIEREDVAKAFISHATSKIKSVSDLDAISTLGFRGEALASVCAVSKVELMTTAEGSDLGTRYVIEGGEEKLIDDVGSPVGTTIIVKDLFYNIPARLKFLKKDVQEGNYIAAVLERIALSNPGVAFKFIRDGKLAFQTPGDGDLKSAVYAVFGKEFTSQLLPVNGEHSGIKIHGFVTKPTAGRGNRSMQTFFVNGRYVKSVIFLTALENAYKNSIMVGKYPGCVLFLEMPYETVDVNVHPAKTEVRFYEDKRVFDAVYNTVLGTLSADFSRPQATFNEAKVFMEPAAKGEQLKISDVVTQPSKAERSFIIKEFGNPVTGREDKVEAPKSNEPKQFDFLKEQYNKPQINIVEEKREEPVKINIAKPEPVVVESVSVEKQEPQPQVIEPVRVIVEEAPKVIVEEPVVQQAEPIVPDFKYIGEAFNTYLMAEVEGKLVIIDKHAAHERILFEKFKAQNKGESQMMLMPVSVNLTADEYSAITENFDLLESAGYEVSDFGDRCVKVSACPPELVNENINEIIIEIAGYLSKNIKTVMPEKLDWILHSMACRAAVKAGNFTSSYEAEKFVGTLLANKEIRFCPHGRPVMVEMTKRELEKQFGRIV